MLEACSRRAASATEISPWITENTIWIFFSTGITGGLIITFRLAFKELDQQLTSLPYAEQTEYGIARDPDVKVEGNYGWLGGHQRSTDTVGGLTLMGARLYNPVSGRFLSMDPVPGGNDNTYTYPPDPVNTTDLSGEWGMPKFIKKAWKKVVHVAKKIYRVVRKVAKAVVRHVYRAAKATVRVVKYVARAYVSKHRWAKKSSTKPRNKTKARAKSKARPQRSKARHGVTRAAKSRTGSAAVGISGASSGGDDILNGLVTVLGFGEACFEFGTAGGIAGGAVGAFFAVIGAVPGVVIGASGGCAVGVIVYGMGGDIPGVPPMSN